MPVPTRERKPALAALAVLLILGGALVSAYLVMVSGQRVSAIRITQQVAAGQPIPPNAMEEVQIGDTGIEYVDWSARSQVANDFAAVTMVKGTLLTNDMVSDKADGTRGKVVVGLALKPGQHPAGLSSGDRVTVYAVSGQGGQSGTQAGSILAGEAIVQTVGGGDADVDSEVLKVSIAIPPEQAGPVSQAASAGTAAVALLPPGTQGKQGEESTQQPPTTQPSTPPNNQSPTNTKKPGN